MSRLFTRALACGALCLIAAAYACDAGHGFVKDDFGWILASRDWSTLLEAPTGFFRPVVSVSFALNYAVFGLEPLGYGLTNLAMLYACLGALVLLLRALGLASFPATASALLWALNFQGINMAVLWTSGRTALLLTLWGVAAASAFTLRHRVAAALFAALAMGSKEEAFMLPAVLTVWAFIDARQRGGNHRDSARTVARETWLLWMAFAVMLVLRSDSGAFTPASAPPLYRYVFDLATLAGNLSGYADRVGTTPLPALLVFWLAAGMPRPGVDADHRRLVAKGVVWIALGFAPTILLPLRSSLYGVMPGVGMAIIVAALAERVAASVAPRVLARAALVLLVAFAALLPVYRLRNARYVREAELSAVIVAELSRISASSPSGGLVVIRDVRTSRPTAEQAFGPLADRAALLMTDGKLQVWIEPPPVELAGVTPPDLSQAIATLVVEQGVVKRNP